MAGRPSLESVGNGSWRFDGAKHWYKSKDKARDARNKMYPKSKPKKTKNTSSPPPAPEPSPPAPAPSPDEGESPVQETTQQRDIRLGINKPPVESTLVSTEESVTAGYKQYAESRKEEPVVEAIIPVLVSPDVVVQPDLRDASIIDTAIPPDQLDTGDGVAPFLDSKTIEVKEPKITETVSHLGVDMTKAQFESDFPPDTQIIDVPAVVSVPEPKATLPDPETFVGIPGPGAGPAPGSLGETLVEGMDKLIEAEEKMFKSVTDPLIETGAKMVEESKSLPSEGKALEGLGMYIGGTVLKAGAAFFEGVTEIVRPGLIGEQIEFAVTVATDTAVRDQVVEVILADPFGAGAQIAGGIAGGVVAGKALGKIADVAGLEQPKSIVRLDDIDVEVKATALGMVDDVDPLTGKTTKVIQVPEVEIIPKTSTKTIPKAMSELMDAELEDLSGTVKLLGVADEGGVTVLEKIDLPEGVLDELLESKTVKVDGTLKTETILMGGDDLAVKAKELGPTIEIETSIDYGIKNAYKKLGIEEVASEIGGEPVKFGGPWLDEGVDGLLGKGQRRYDVKGVLIENVDSLDDVVDDFVTKIEPMDGKKTAWDINEQNAALKGTQDILKDGPPEVVVPSSNYWKNLLENGPTDPLPELRLKYLSEMAELVPIVKIVTETSKTSAVLPLTGGVIGVPEPSVIEEPPAYTPPASGDTPFPTGGLFTAPPEQKSGYPSVRDDSWSKFNTFETPPWAEEKTAEIPKRDIEKVDDKVKTGGGAKSIEDILGLPKEDTNPFQGLGGKFKIIDDTKPKSVQIPDITPDQDIAVEPVQTMQEKQTSSAPPFMPLINTGVSRPMAFFSKTKQGRNSRNKSILGFERRSYHLSTVDNLLGTTRDTEKKKRRFKLF